MMEKNNRKLVCIIVGIALILMTQGCNDEQVSEQQPDHRWFTPSVVDDVYAPAIVEDVYSKQ